MSSKNDFISFPPGYLGGRPQKFPLIANEEGFFALNKPAGLASAQHEWTLGKPDISMALRRELLNEKPQLARLGIEGLYRVYNLDAEVSGVLLFAKNELHEEILKNAVGSSQLRFKFHLLAAYDGEEREFLCDLPLARHVTDRRMLVSHKTGKKCETRFRFVRQYGRYQLWEAETSDMRVHQARVHAAERGLRVVGESLYSKGDQIYLSQLKKGYQANSDREERPIYAALCLHLLEVAFAIPDSDFDPIAAPLPSRFETLLKRLGGPRKSRP